MKCISSPALGDAQIISFIEGEADVAVVTHIADCAYCAEKADRWKRLQNRLRARLYRMDCPSPMELGDYHLHMLPPSQMLIVAQHLRECPHCAREVNELQNYLSELELPETTGVLGGIKVLIARLVGESSSRSVAASALRGERKGPVTYEADGLVIILDIQAAPSGQASILGQVAADDQDRWTGAVAELRQVDAPPKTTSLDDLGSFRFEEALIGSTELTITSSYDIIVQIPKFDLVV